jgi:hypothetical protein
LVVKNGSKILSRTSGGMPEPGVLHAEHDVRPGGAAVGVRQGVVHGFELRGEVSWPPSAWRPAR